MKKKWINQSGNTELILFFNGWGMDERPLSHLSPDGYDVLMCYDYTCLPKEPISEVSGYRKVHVVAWSMGVWVAAQYMNSFQFHPTSAIAINGTPLPIDDTFGIPKAVFDGTLNGWGEATRPKFNLRMCGDKQTYEAFLKVQPNRSVESQKEELSALREMVQSHAPTEVPWTKAIIGRNDRIFPFANLEKYWQNRTAGEVNDYGHLPFFNFSSWKQLLG